MKTKKRLLSILLSLVMVLGLMPGMSLTAYADDNTVTWSSSQIRNIRIDVRDGMARNNTISGITVTGSGSTAAWMGDMIDFGPDGSFTFTSSVGNISAIVISASTRWVEEQLLSSGWSKTSSGLSWSGTAAASVTLSAQFSALDDVSQIVFTKASAHTHSFTYSASGATITATCSATGCTLPPSTEGGTDHVAKLTIVKPTLTTVGGTGDAAATLDADALAAFNAATGKSLAATDIKYVGRDGTTYAESATAPTKAGKYTAKLTLSGVKTAEGEDKSVTASVEYSIKYTVTFETNGGTPIPEQQLVEAGGYATRPKTDPEKEGSVFGDWYADASFNRKYGFNEEVTENTTVYAKFGEHRVSWVIYTGANQGSYMLSDVFTGTVPAADSDDRVNQVKTFLEMDLPEGATFTDWTTETDASGNVTYTVRPLCPVTLHANDGTINTGNVTSYICGTGATLPTDVTRAKYDFGGWFDNSEFTGTAVTQISTTDSGSKEYWAKWTPVYAVAATVTANNRTYDGTEQPLVTVTGEPTGGTMQYALGTATEATEQYTTSIRTATNAGTYYVWYKAVGDANHNDTAAACVTAKILAPISATVTFKVVNGAWDDGTTADKTVTLTGYEGDTLKLAADQIPAVGSKPNDTYKAGSWDVTPSTETAITENVTYTYTYADKDSVSATVTFKVVNGAWDDETTADKTVTLTGAEGDTLKLSADQIPAVGSKPNDTYKAGSWDVTPSTDTAITEATTYTYTYAQKDSISQTVTFKVVNGSWNDETTADKTVTLTGYEGDTLKLSADQIPAVGNKPADTFKAGAWDEVPSTETAITQDTTYTYTYEALDEKEAASVTKAPKAIDPTYSAKAQKLVTAGAAEGGTMVYAVTQGKSAPKASAYAKSIPTGIDAGVYYVWYKAVGDADHADSKPAKVKVTVKRLDIKKCKITARPLDYTGKKLKPDVTVKHGKKKLAEKKDYTLAYGKKIVKPGEYDVTVAGKGNYKGSKKLKFEVRQPEIAITDLKGDIHSFTVKWTEKEEMDGYQIQFCKRKDMSGKQTVTFRIPEMNPKCTKTIVGLSDGTRYYVRIRGYRIIDKKKHFTAWSAVESVKTKPENRKNEGARQAEMSVGETLDLKAALAEGEVAADWITDDTAIVAVTEEGFVTAMQTGNAAVIAILENGGEIEFAISVREDGVVLLDLAEDDLALDLEGDVFGNVIGDAEMDMEMEIEN